MALITKLQRIFPGCIALLCLLAVATPAQQRARTVAEPAPAENSYRIRKGDKLSIRFLYQPELNEPAAAVRPDGFITLQMIDDVKAEGLTTAELKAKIEQAYGETLLNPVVSVSVIEFVAPRIFVGGQVAKPGSYELRAGQTVLQAVILAGGFTHDAHRKMVLHARPIGERELKVTVIDITRLMTPGSAEREALLQDGDYVYVPDSKISKLTRMIDAFRFAVPGFAIR